jgi:hypothetical protein
MIVRRSDFKGEWDSGPFAQKNFMNSDSGGERDSEEYNNPTERQDEQAARHQDEGTQIGNVFSKRCSFDYGCTAVSNRAGGYFCMLSKQKIISRTISISGASLHLMCPKSFLFIVVYNFLGRFKDVSKFFIAECA